ncbi:MAG: ATP-binding protein [Pseudomonadota bacterium]
MSIPMQQNDSMQSDVTSLGADVQARARPLRGKLRIYFGASNGVGKACAMLRAAQEQRALGRAVLLVASGLDGQEQLLVGLEVQAGGLDGVFDLDAVLARRPDLLVIDHLAHTNPGGARHPKRWQDVEEMLEAGIDVYSTLNVQHIESLSDVVGVITGSGERLTVPDTVFDGADEVVFVDLPAEDVSGRCAADGTPTARLDKGQLVALRELALRRTAEQMENDVRAFRAEESIKPVWKTSSALLACVGPQSEAEHVIRSAAQLAGQSNAEWQAVYIETPRLQNKSAGERQQMLEKLKLAESLGASTAVLSGSDIALTIADYARSQNFSKIVLGRSHRTWRFPWDEAHLARIAAYAPDIDLFEIGRAAPAPARNSAIALAGKPVNAGEPAARPEASRRKRYVFAAAASLFTALICLPLLPYFDLANIAMLFLLTVVLVSVRFGREASVVATCIGVVALMLATRRVSFAASDLQYTVTFLVMLAVGLITGRLTADLRYQARIAMHRESRSRALYEFARSLSGALLTEQVFDITRSYVQRSFAAHATLLTPDAQGRLQYPAASGAGAVPVMSVLDLGLAQWAFDRATPAGNGTDTLPANSFFYLPLVAPMRTRGVLVVWSEQGRWMLTPEQRKQLDTFAALAAIALERVHYVEVAQEAVVRMESERLRNSLLAALSHDLRTPLTSLVGLSESLAMSKPALAPQQQEVALSLRDEAVRMSTLVSNLLDMARIQSGHVKLNLQWQTLEEVVGSALRASRWQLGAHEVQTDLARALPLLRFDAVLIERVLCNLLENAAKYTPPGCRIGVRAQVLADLLEVTVYDNGPGLPAGREEAIFEKFTRGERESPIPGVGLGLAICRAIMQAHGGSIRAAAATEGGAAFIFTLPLGVPPELPFMDDSEGGSADESTTQ